MKIGLKNSNPANNLYPNYLKFCRESGYSKVLTLNKFSILLVQQLNSLISKSIKKLKTREYNVITDIILNLDNNNTNFVSLNAPTPNLIDEFTGYFEGDFNPPISPDISPSHPSSSFNPHASTLPPTISSVVDNLGLSTNHVNVPVNNRTKKEILEKYRFLNEYVLEEEVKENLKNFKLFGRYTLDKVELLKNIDFCYIRFDEVKFYYTKDEFFFPFYYDYCDKLPQKHNSFIGIVAEIYVDLLCFKKLLKK